MDEELTLHELRRLEAERKLRSIPEDVLETAWAREAQIEAVIDAVLAVTFADSPRALAHARHVGEWCARIASGIEFGPEPWFARRVGVLADVDPCALEMLPELERFAGHVRAFQTVSIAGSNVPSATTLIVYVAGEFSRRLARYEDCNGPALSVILETMSAESDQATRPFVLALVAAVRPRGLRVA